MSHTLSSPLAYTLPLPLTQFLPEPKICFLCYVICSFYNTLCFLLQHSVAFLIKPFVSESVICFALRHTLDEVDDAKTESSTLSRQHRLQHGADAVCVEGVFSVDATALWAGDLSLSTD